MAGAPRGVVGVKGWEGTKGCGRRQGMGGAPRGVIGVKGWEGHQGV